MQQETFHWPHKDLLDVDQLTQEELFHLLDTAANLHEINSRPVKKVPILKGKSVVLFFAEPSTRTKTSFDMAGKRLSADTFGLAKSGSSLQKGESMKDTALTLQAMNPDVIVIRHSSSGAAQFLAERLHCGVVNAGDGWHAHPTQALLDAFSLRQVWGHDRNAFKGKNLLILGDCAHSRVCRSNVLLLTKLGVNVSLCAPRTLLPAGVDNWPVTVYTDSKKAVRDMDAVMCLRSSSNASRRACSPTCANIPNASASPRPTWNWPGLAHTSCTPAPSCADSTFPTPWRTAPSR